MKRLPLSLLALALALAPRAFAEAPRVSFAATPGFFALTQDNATAPLVVDAGDWPGVQRAARDLQADVERVSARRPALGSKAPVSATIAVFIGTIGRSPLIDDLVRRGKIDVSGVAGKWETFVHEVVEQPLPGIDRALVIAGSDKRGTIYGIYDLSGAIGVSPWYWWADVTPEHHDALFVAPGRVVCGEPSVKYRGIFLNDEKPDLTNWVHAKFGDVPVGENPPVPSDVANYNHEFYARIFEVLLRLRGNYLWPAMWNNAFNEDDPANARLADEFGIVMGTSHQEPMLRAQKEWDRRYLKTLGTWNYAQHPDVMENFWREGVRRNKNFESIVTLGLRGANDTEMAPGGPAANQALLEKIVGVQRNILREEVNPDLTKVPQLWCLYKEVQDYYEAGMRAPDDVTLLWAEDNWGNLRRLPTAEERTRRGGAGIYYHFDYHGNPRSYQWLDTSPLPKIWEQMSLAKQYGADRIWIVNVGHFKGYELPMEYFMNLAWDANDPGNADTREFTRRWAAREFGAARAADIAEILARYAQFNARRKPEMLAPDTYSLVDYHEAETVVSDYRTLAGRAEEIFATLPAGKRDAFDELVLFPTQAGALVNELYFAAGKNALYARQGRASANEWAAETRNCFQRYLDLVGHYDREIAGGRWAHFMDQPVLGYTTWRDPPLNNLNHLALVTSEVPSAPALGVAVEGSAEAWPGAGGAAKLPAIDGFNRQRRYVEIFNRGKTPFDFSAAASVSWIVVSDLRGQVTADRRVWITIDWSQAPRGRATGTVKFTGAGGEVQVLVDLFNPTEPTGESRRGFVEAEGFVSVEAEHFTRKLDAGANHWMKIDNYGRTLSGLRADGPVDVVATPGKDSPCLEYGMKLFSAGLVRVTAITAPSLNFLPHREVRYAVAFDDEAPQTVTLVPRDFKARNGNADWEKSVGDNARYSTSTHTLAQPGVHTLKIWMIDPGVVLQKIVVDAGGVRPSYLGPPESFFRSSP